MPKLDLILIMIKVIWKWTEILNLKVSIAISTFKIVHSVHPSPISAGGLNLLPNFQKVGASQDLNFERGLLEKRG